MLVNLEGNLPYPPDSGVRPRCLMGVENFPLPKQVRDRRRQVDVRPPRDQDQGTLLYLIQGNITELLPLIPAPHYMT